MTTLPKRALEAAVLFFALYAFMFVPLGEKTGFEHLEAILSTKEASRAGEELKTAGSRMLRELLSFHNGKYEGEPVLPRLPGPGFLTPGHRDAPGRQSAPGHQDTQQEHEQVPELDE